MLGFLALLYLASVLSAHVSVWDHTQGNGKQVGPMKPAASVCCMHALAMVDIPNCTKYYLKISICKSCLQFGTIENVHAGTRFDSLQTKLRQFVFLSTHNIM